MLKPEVLKVLRSIIDREEIEEAWEILKQNWNAVDAAAAIAFRVGDPVTWDGKRGTQTGTVTRVNHKTCSVKVPLVGGGATTWKVGASMLKKV